MGFFSQSHCPAQRIPCDFALYANATNLADDQKLLPNLDITGDQATKAFIITGYLAFVSAVCLIFDEWHLLQAERKAQADPSRESLRDRAFYNRIIHMIDTLLHGLSDTQLVSGLSLLVATYFQDCTVSAYHYDVVCYMILMSLITHIVAFMNIPHFFKKNVWPAILRLLGMLATLIVAWMLFKQRDVAKFPTKPGSMAILPAQCFTANTSVTDASYWSSHNMTEIFLSSDDDDGAAFEYKLLFLPISAMSIVSLIFLGVDSVSDWLHNWWTFGVRCTITFLTAIVIALATVRYENLRSGMEVDEWYLAPKDSGYSYSQIVSLALLASTSIPFFKAIQETIDGPRGKSAINVQATARFGGKMAAQDQEAGAY